MKQYLVSALLTLSFIPSTALCQSGPSCPSGIHADGYVDFTQLPAPPQPVAGQVQGPFTYTLPVSGVAGLTVQVTIPAGPAGQQAYSVGEGEIGLPGHQRHSGLRLQ